MQTLFILRTYMLILLCLVGLVSTKSKRDVEISERIKGSIKTGNVQELVSHFEKNVELVIDSESVSIRNVRTKQAELILKGFFKKYPPREFKYVFQGTASKVRYCTASYQPAAGGNFQVYILMKVTEKDYLINTLHFKKE